MNKSASTEGRDPLVVLPGLLCDSRMFGFQVRAFGALVIDGFYGEATRLEAMADYALARMPARCALLGHSMGARVALEVWRKAPERVARLALCDSGIHPVRTGEAEGRYALCSIGRSRGAAALVDAWLPPMIGPLRRNDPALLAILRPMCIDAGVEVYARQIEALLARPDLAPLLASIDCPTVAIVGADDRWAPVDQHREIAASIDGAELRVVPRAGHMLPIEQPDLFNDRIEEWLNFPTMRRRDSCNRQPTVETERHVQ